MYYAVDGVEEDETRGIHHWQRAATEGHGESRFGLGYAEYENRNYKVAMQHWVISSKMGYGNSLHSTKDMFKEGHADQGSVCRGIIRIPGRGTPWKRWKSPQR